ncbi:MAG TPA: helix-turn-helix domain-containing protein [Paenibacillus sp.]
MKKINLFRRKQNWLTHFMLSYFPIFLLITSLLISICFLSISYLTKKSAVSASKEYLKFVQESVDYRIQNIDEYTLNQIENDVMLKEFIKNTNDGNYFTDYLVSQKLYEFKKFSSLIDSVYLYRHADKSVISTEYKVSLDKFGDREFIKQNIGRPPYLISKARELQLDSSSKSYSHQVISIIRNIPLLSNQQDYIVVNISVNAINEQIRKMSAEVGFVNIYDSDYNPILINNSDNGQTLSEITSTYTGWLYKSSIKNGQLLGIGFIASYIWVGLMIVITILGLIWIILIARRNYKPIESMINLINNYSNEMAMKFSKKRNDFQFIENALENLIMVNNENQKKNEENEIITSRQLFQQLMEDRLPISIDEYEKKLMHFNMEVNQPFTAAIISIDKYEAVKEAYSEKDIYLLKFILSSVVGEISNNHNIAVWSDWISHKQLGVLFQTADNKNESMIRILQICHEIRLWIDQHVHFTITIGTGEIASDLTGVSRSYSEALQALTYKPALGNNNVISFSEVDQAGVGKVYRYNEDVIQMIRMFRICDPAWEKYYDHIFAILKELIVSQKDIEVIVDDMTYLLSTELTMFPADIVNYWERGVLPKFKGLFRECDTLDEMQVYLKESMDNLYSLMKSHLDRNSNNTVMNKIRSYLDEHFADLDLSLSVLSEKFNINKNNVSRLFKEEYGDTFMDYVTMLRIKHAKGLLEDSTLTIQEIAERTGYRHSISLIRSFKKVTGITPGEFRKETNA